MRNDLETVADEWPIRQLGDVASVTLGGTPSTSVPAFWHGDIRWMASGEVNLRQVWDVEGRITEAGLAGSNATLVDPPAVAVGLAGQGKTRGTVALVHVRLCTNQSIALIKGNNGILDTRYLFHNLDGRYEELRARSSGGGRGGLSRGVLAKVPIAVPELPEQRRLADILDTANELIRVTEHVIVKLQELKSGLRRDLLTRGIDESGEVRHPERGAKGFRDTPLGRVPAHWRIEALEVLAEVLDHRRVPVNAEERAKRQGDVPYYGANGQQGWIDRPLFDEPLVLLAEDGGNFDDYVTRPIAYRIDGPSWVNNHAHVLRAAPGVDQAFLFFALEHRDIRRYISGGTRTKLTQGELKSIEIPTPALEEQRRIARALESQDRRIAVERRTLAKYRLLKQGLMSDLLTGRTRASVNEVVAA